MTAKSFETASVPPPIGSTSFVLDSWDSIRDAGIDPLNVSEVGGSDTDRAEFIRGAELLRLCGDKALPRVMIQPQQLLVHDVLAAGFGNNAILQPRRSAKTTSLIAEGLGRAEAREDYRVGILTATTGKAGRSRFTRDVVPRLTRMYPDAGHAPFKITRAAGQEAVTFHDSGGFVSWLSTVDDARGEAFDLLIVDEAQDAEPGQVEDILAALMPTLDTRDGSQIVVAGTAGRYRRGNLLWDWLAREGVGVIRYAVPDHTSDEELASWEPTDEHPAGHVRELVEASHPGLAGLTRLETIKDNFDALPIETFSREYLGLFGLGDSSSGIFNTDRWKDTGLDDDLPEPPEHFALVVGAHPDQKSASIVAVWREDGLACILLLDHRRGVRWLPEAAVKLSRRYRTPIIHDSQGPILAEAEVMGRMRPRPRLLPQSFRDVKTAAALAVREVENGRVRHWNQPELNEAVRLARKRSVGPSAWALGRPDADADIVPAECFAMGLRMYDQGTGRGAILPPGMEGVA